MRLADKASDWHDTQTEQKQNKKNINKRLRKPEL